MRIAVPGNNFSSPTCFGGGGSVSARNVPTVASRKSASRLNVASENASPPSNAASGSATRPWKVAPENNAGFLTCSLRNWVMP